jgi:pimeloyl-ACP methyl ester carboxylesterase
VGAYAASEGCLALVPSDYRRDGTLPAVICAHSRGATHTQFDNAIHRRLARNLPVFGGDVGGTTSWGNPTSVTRMGDLKTYAQGVVWGAKSGAVYVYGGSMGGAVACNWARQNIASVKALALAGPILDLDDFHDQNLGGFQAEINTAYTDSATFESLVPTHSPFAYAAALASLPIKVWYSTGDELALPAKVTSFASTTGAQTEVIGSGAHGVDTLPTNSLSDFFLAHP